jgi:hypothetical protein
LTGKVFIEACNEMGLSLNQTNFSYYRFAAETFEGYEFASSLTRNAIEKLQPLFAAYEKLVTDKHITTDASAHIKVLVTPFFARFDKAWPSL